MDTNYLLHRHQVSLHKAATSGSRCARIAHQAFAKAYGLLLLRRGFPINPAASAPSSSTAMDGAPPTALLRWEDEGGAMAPVLVRLPNAEYRPVSFGRARQHDGWPAGTTVGSLADRIPGRPPTAGKSGVAPDGDTAGAVLPLPDIAA